MIKVLVKPKRYSVTMTGHADYGEPGSDIVCAAASMLFYTLAETVTSYPKESFKKKPFTDTGKKNVIACTPKSEYRANFDVIYQTILNGLLLLEQNYPDNVKVTVED